MVRLSDLVRKSEGPRKEGKPSERQAALAFAELGFLATEAAPARAAEQPPREEPLPSSPPAGPAPPPLPPEPLYQSARDEVARVVVALQQGRPCELGPLQAALEGLIRSLAAGEELLACALREGETHLELPTHLVNVTILALKIGQGLGYGPAELARLALAGALHDVGMTSIPRRLLEKPGALSPEELALIRQHPERGYRMLQQLGPAYDWVATVALQEHEREDGSGYPHGLPGERIHEYAKIIGLGDVYESLSHARSYQQVRIPFYVARELMSAERHRFADRILRGLIRGLSAFPVGSLVRLNSREIARVVAPNPTLPLRPVVEVLAGPTGERLAAPRRVDLAQNALLYIMDAAPAEVEDRRPSLAFPAKGEI
jgi:hypothetical protein